jgi:hypothetical protein
VLPERDWRVGARREDAGRDARGRATQERLPRRHSGDYGDDEQRSTGASGAVRQHGFGCYRPLKLGFERPSLVTIVVGTPVIYQGDIE